MVLRLEDWVAWLNLTEPEAVAVAAGPVLEWAGEVIGTAMW